MQQKVFKPKKDLIISSDNTQVQLANPKLPVRARDTVTVGLMALHRRDGTTNQIQFSTHPLFRMLGMHYNQ